MDLIVNYNPEAIQEKDSFVCLNLSKDKSILKPNYYSGLTLAFIPCDRVEDYGDYTIDDECIRN